MTPMQTAIGASALPRFSLYGLGSVALGGLVGGPLACGYLVVGNLAALRLHQRRFVALGFFAVASVLWFWSLYQVPRDALSELLVHLPQWLIWCLFSWVILKRQHSAFAAGGGTFRSAWVGAGIGVLISVALRFLLRAVPLLA